jgi:hypothetical protein
MANTTKKGKGSRRLDKNRLTLCKGETQRKDGTYDFRWTSPDGKRHSLYSLYATALEELREKEMLLMERKYQEEAGLHCKATVDCFTDFIFINRFGEVQHQGT